jgi:hypothetical protein
LRCHNECAVESPRPHASRHRLKKRDPCLSHACSAWVPCVRAAGLCILSHGSRGSWQSSAASASSPHFGCPFCSSAAATAIVPHHRRRPGAKSRVKRSLPLHAQQRYTPSVPPFPPSWLSPSLVLSLPFYHHHHHHQSRPHIHRLSSDSLVAYSPFLHRRRSYSSLNPRASACPAQPCSSVCSKPELIAVHVRRPRGRAPRIARSTNRYYPSAPLAASPKSHLTSPPSHR